MKPHLLFGYVAKIHGLKGELLIHCFDPDCDVFDFIKRVLVVTPDGVERELALQQVRPATPGNLLVRFRGIGSRAAAEGLKQGQLSAFREDLPPVGDDEVFQGDLVGLAAVTPEGVALGVVEEVWRSGPVPNLVIRGEGGELMIPLVDDFVHEIDLTKRQVVVTPLEIDG